MNEKAKKILIYCILCEAGATSTGATNTLEAMFKGFRACSSWESLDNISKDFLEKLSEGRNHIGSLLTKFLQEIVRKLQEEFLGKFMWKLRKYVIQYFFPTGFSQYFTLINFCLDSSRQQSTL